jgi:hypothetical protein
MFGPSPSPRAELGTFCGISEVGLETLALLYYLRHGFDACDVFRCNFLVLEANIAIEALNGAVDGVSSNVLQSTIILCAQVSKARPNFLSWISRHMAGLEKPIVVLLPWRPDI